MDKLVYFTMYDHCKLADSFERNAREIGFEHIEHFDLMNLINSGFYKKHRRKFDTLKNAGCVWKPYIISEVINRSIAGDFIYYSDVTDLLKPGLLEIAKAQARLYSYLLVRSNFVNCEWTKWDCFRLMNCDSESYLEVNQLDAGQLGFFITQYTKEFINHWLELCENDDLLLDHTITSERFNLKRHSRDQSILTNLARLYKIPAIPINEYIKYYTPNFRSP